MKKLLQTIFSKDIDSICAQVAYYLLLSIFPFLYLVTKLAAVFSVSSSGFLDTLYFILPNDIYYLIVRNLDMITGDSSATLLSASILIAVWSASRATNSLKKAFGADMNFIHLRLTSVVMTLVFALIILFSLLATLLLNIITGYLSSYLRLGYATNIFSLFVTFVIVVTDVVIIYMFLPPQKIKFLDALPGALFATFGFLITSFVFSTYVNYVADFTRLYGAMGSVVGLMLWLYICAYVVVLGGEINQFCLGKIEKTLKEHPIRKKKRKKKSRQ